MGGRGEGEVKHDEKLKLPMKPAKAIIPSHLCPTLLLFINSQQIVLHWHAHPVPTKRVQPIPADTERKQAGESKFTRGGSAVIDAKRQRILKPFADALARFLRANGGETTLTKASIEVKKAGDFAKASLEAGISQKRVMAAFLETFPSMFATTTSKTGGAALVKLK